MYIYYNIMLVYLLRWSISSETSDVRCNDV